MSMKDIDLAALEKDLRALAARKRRRGWLRRNWLWFLPTLLLALIVLAAAVGYWWLFVRVYRLDVCRAAMQTIQNSKELQEKLGLPIGVVWWPSQSAAPNAQIEDRDIDVRWSIEGPKGRAKAHAHAWMTREDKWELKSVTVDGKEVPLPNTGSEAPPFQSPKPAGKTPESKAPPDINLPVPPADAPP